MLDIARAVKGFFDKFSKSSLLGFHMDWFFHLVGAAFFVYLVSRFLPLKRTVQLATALILLKEVFDIFAKTRMEYIRPPTQDLLVDLSSGFLGVLAGWWLARRHQRSGQERLGQGA